MSDLALHRLTATGSQQVGAFDSAQAQLTVTSQPVASAAALQSAGANARALSQAQSTVSPSQTQTSGAPVEYKGWLYKWTNYIKGYQKRWFILENGYLSYYRNQAEVAHTCRGTINLTTATIQHDDPLTIVLQNGTTNVFHLKAVSEVERQQWLTKLELAKASQARPAAHLDAVRALGLLRGRFVDEDEDDEDDEQRDEAAGRELEKQLTTLSSKMDDLHTCFSLICKHHADLSRLLSEQLPQPAPAKSPPLGDRERSANAPEREKELSEKLKLFKITAQAMLNASQEYYDTATQQGRRWQRLLEREHEQRVQFEGMVEQLARQQRQLERQAIRGLKSARAASPAPRVDLPDATAPAPMSGPPHASPHGAAPVAPKPDPTAKTAAQNGASSLLTIAAPLKQHPSSVGAQQARAPSSSDSDDEDANGDFYDALDIESPAAVAPAYFKLSNALPNTNTKAKTGFGSVSSTSSQDSIGSLPLSGPSNHSARSEGSKAAVVHQRSQSDWSSTQQSRAEAGGSAPTSPQRSQSKQSVVVSASGATPSADGQSQPADQTPSASSADNQLVRADGAFTKLPLRTRPRRTAIPFKPASSINLWSIIKNCVGRELSKIPFPVNFSEPISMLQRLVEDLEYSQLLDQAALCTDPVEQMALVAVFNVSSYATTANRATKPFNPVLGETYELDRTDDTEFGWRLISEQVSHHPPAASFHCESATWVCYEEFTLGSKFRGMYLQVQPLGFAHCEFKRDRNHYTWSRVTTMVHNIIVGKLWIDNIGECVVVNHTLGIRCFLKFVQYTYFRSDLRRVLGVVKDRNDEARYILYGTWDEKMEGARLKRPAPGARNPYANLDPDGVPKVWNSLDASEKKLLWRRNDYPPNSDKMYNFTTFALQLNEPEPGVAPTDSRMRPDQRLMEQGQWDEANTVKLRVEEKQRAARRALEKQNEERSLNGLQPIEHRPVWFKRQHDPYTKQDICVYAGEYWDCKRRGDWSKALDIF